MLPQNVRGIRWQRGLAIGCCALWLSVAAAEAAGEESPDLLDISYIHAAVLGTGTYQVKNRRLTMFRLPLSWKQRSATEDSPGWRWLFPVVLGYDDLGSIDSDIIESLLPDKLVTLSVMPGVEYVHPVTANFQVKPFAEIGGGRDFGADETFALLQFGVRSLWTSGLGRDWTILWGNALRWAGEHQFDSGDGEKFGIFDTGLDLRRRLPWRLFDQQLDLGAYYIYERFLPNWTLGETEDWQGRARELHEFGLSLGVPEGTVIRSPNLHGASRRSLCPRSCL
jgi:hypothetical protein